VNCRLQKLVELSVVSFHDALPFKSIHYTYHLKRITHHHCKELLKRRLILSLT